MQTIVPTMSKTVCGTTYVLRSDDQVEIEIILLGYNICLYHWWFITDFI